MVTMLFFQVLVLPVNIAFYSSDFSATWLAINGISDAVFLIDIVFNFFTGIPDLDDEHLVRYDGACYAIHVQFLLRCFYTSDHTGRWKGGGGGDELL